MANRQSLLERYKRQTHSDYWINYAVANGGDNLCAAKMYGQTLAEQKFSFSVAKALFATSAYNTGANFDDFTEGFFGTPACLHFVGMQDSRQYRNAIRQWGTPDYDWPTASFRILGECAPHDTVIFGTSAFVKPKKWRAAS